MRNRIVLALLGACCLLVTSCDLRLTAPVGEGPLRYRDAVFTSVDKTADLTYGSAPLISGTVQTLKLDLYEPHGDTIEARPAIVWVHGGSFKSGNKTSPELVDEATTFAKMGYVNVSIDYRLSAGCAPFTDECITGIGMAKNDAQAAVRWLRANAATYRIDARRIAIGGSSAGAITAYNVAYGPDSVGDSGNPGYPSTVRAAASLSGAPLTTTPDPGEPPTLDFHGTADTLVPMDWVTPAITMAHNRGLVAEQTVWDGAGHVPYADHRTEILEQTRNFFYITMDLGHAAR